MTRLLPPGLARAVDALGRELPGRWFREIDAPYYRPMGLLEDPNTIAKRYFTIPPEAVPVLDTGVDGCHVGLWFDEATPDDEPSVVYVSPMDSNVTNTALGDVIPIFPNVRQFIERDFRGGIRHVVLEALGRSCLSEKNIARNRAQRAARTRAPTLDGMGVVLPNEANIPDAELDEAQFRDAVASALGRKDFGTALLLGRNAITRGCADASWLSASLADAYLGLHRPFLASEVVACYTRER